MRVAILILLTILSAGLLAGETLATTQLERLITELGADDFQRRETASRTLVAAGDTVLKDLSAARAKSQDAEIKARITKIRIAVLAKHPQRALKLVLKVPKSIDIATDRPLPGLPGIGKGVISGLDISMENITDEALLVCRLYNSHDIQLKLLDERGEVAGTAALIGTSSGEGYQLSERDYITVKPGERASLMTQQHFFALEEPETLKPGKYKLVAAFSTLKQELSGSVYAPAAVAELRAAVFKGEWTSAPVELELSAPIPAKNHGAPTEK